MLRISPLEVRPSEYSLIDVREYPEYVAAAIALSELVPLSTLKASAAGWLTDRRILLICRSGKRAEQAAAQLSELGFTQVAVLEGGIEAWRQRGLPVESSARKPWSLERQVRVIAGSIVVIATTLGLTVSPCFFGVSLFIGAGLTFAGISDICMMATLLAKLPWNRP